MKKILLAVCFALSATAAQATIVSGNGYLSLNDTGTVTFSGDINDVVLGATGGYLGQLSATQDTILEVTYLGKEAANKNFYVQSSVNVFNTDLSSIGDVQVFDISAGLIDFGFTGNGGLSANNATGLNLGHIAYIVNGAEYGVSGYDFIIGFNDGGSLDGDFDDVVVGVNAVPVPAALPLMASALAMFGVARRRKTLA
ncbi:MAG: hypothetical protein SFU55_04180 [Methylophilus sp.]|nr:hypothetical protein [Methylophilus sp.]